MYFSGGYLDNSRKGKFGVFNIWFNQASLANISSLSLVAEDYQFTFDSWYENAIIVHISPNHVIKFICGEDRLYYFNTSSVNLHQLRNDFSLLNTMG